MKPWIHLFKTFDCYYFYDVNKNESIKIEEAVYSYLNCLLHANEDIMVDKNIISYINLLQSQGYLKPSGLESIEHPETKNLNEYISRRLSLLTIQLTQDCNLRCLYCPYTSNDGTNRTHSNKTISLDSIERALHIMEESSVDRECVTIGFYGGEPLLEFGLLVKATQYAEKIFEGKQLKYTITTNATLLNKEICEFLEKRNFLVVVSLDGPKHINDINRKLSNNTSSVFERVIENLEYISINHPSLYDNLSINMVIDQSQEFHDYIIFFEQYPFLDKVGLNATLVEDDHKINKHEISEKFLTDYNHSKLLTHLYLMNFLSIKNNKLLVNLFARQIYDLRNLLEPKIPIGKSHCPSGSCIPGETRLFLNASGKFFPCERVSETIDFNCIGDLQSGIDVKRAQEILNVARRTYDGCKECFAFRHCTLCIKGHECGFIEAGKIKEKCEIVRLNFHRDLKSHAILKELELC